MSDKQRQAALDYHRFPKPGKLEIKATKPLSNQQDLALAYSPGVAAACEAIDKDPSKVSDYTARSNLVAVITNGTAVLGLGAIGALASKPVMEGKAVLFKQFADIDVFDIEINELDPQKFIDTVARLEPTFGGINLEDIKAPECFTIEEGLKERLNIPVFHDDQHGTAIVVCAAILNGLRYVGKEISEIRVVTSGAGAAALACLNLLIKLGLKREHIILTDRDGVVFKGREGDMDPYKAAFATDASVRTLEEALNGADLFLGLSAGGILKPEWLAKMTNSPIIMALANPTPEIMPELALKQRPDAIIATGRSDYPNQVNNVLCFPFLFRGALDVGATEINSEMKMAAVRAIADLAMEEPSDIVRAAYGGQNLSFGPDYLIPRAFDPRLMEKIPVAVAQAAIDSGVATRPYPSLKHYQNQLHNKVFRTGMTMRPIFDLAKKNLKRVVYAEGEEEKVLQAAQQVIDNKIANPIFVGSRVVIAEKVASLGLKMREVDDYQIIDPHHNDRFDYHSDLFYQQVQRKGYSPCDAKQKIRNNRVALAATLVKAGEADAMICGIGGHRQRPLEIIEEVIGKAPGVTQLTSLCALVIESGTYFVNDIFVQEDPDAAQLAENIRLCQEEVRWFGCLPKVALLSHSNFGSRNNRSAQKMRDTLDLVREQLPDLEIEGEMHADMAVSEDLRSQRFPGSMLNGSANLLVMPNIDAANISFNLLKQLGNGLAIGPILVGTAQSVHVLPPSTTVRGLLNMTAVAAVRASTRQETSQ